MRQIIFVNEARVELAPEKYRVEDDVEIYSPQVNKETEKERRNKHRAAREIVQSLNNNSRIKLAPEDMWEEPETKSPEVQRVMNSMDNPAYHTKKMQKIW